MLTLYNTLTKKKEPFEPRTQGVASMYTCGPTVYGKVHIGNLRSYLTADMVRRVLEQSGIAVRHVKNITDVGHLAADDVAQGDSGEDKIEKKARIEGKSPEEISRFYETYFLETEWALNILPAHEFPRATEHITSMIKLAEQLIEKGHAYVSNGNVFLDVTSFPQYGMLSGNTIDKLKTGARLEVHPDKRHPWDFALWLKNPEGHLMHWPSPWSEGYPGWHIECSAMSMRHLGPQFDIHTGGEDNIFPHHEAEIVQSEGATGCSPFSRFWVHSRHLLADGEKMSKSKGNLYTLEDIKSRGFTPMDLRLALLSSHYRSQMNFTWKAMEQARTNRKTIQSFHDRLENLLEEDLHPRENKKSNLTNPTAETKQHETETFTRRTQQYKKNFINSLEDDINTPEAITALLTLVREGNKAIDAKKFENAEETKKIFLECINLLGLVFEEKNSAPEEIRRLAEAREIARQEKNFPEADRLRGEIESAGFTVEDTANGSVLKISSIQNA